MSLPPPAAVGMALAEVDTPALLIDLDAFERNLQRMGDFARSAGVRLRPHSKTHKSPDIAARQIAHGAVGVCCQKVSEAEVMVAGGIGDVLVSNEVAGAAKLDRLAALARRAKIAICADDADNVAEIEAAAAKAGAAIDVLVEIDVGGRRCGTPPGAPAARIAERIARSPHLRFAGLQAYHGSAQHVREARDRSAHIARAVDHVKETQGALKAVGLRAATVTGALPRQAMDACIADEQGARDELVKDWAQFSGASKTQCVHASSDYLPSYVEVLTCLSMAKAAKGLPEEKAQRPGKQKGH